MKQSRIEEIVNAYADATFSEDQKRFMLLACENVERETRQDFVSAVYDLANKVAVKPRQSD